MFRQEVVDQAVQDLVGTCNAMYEVVDVTSLLLQELSAIEDVIFLCEVCGWWYDMSDLDDSVCTGCAND